MKGKIKILTSNGTELIIDVEILQERTMFGRPEWLVKPVSGEGQFWTQKLEQKA